MVKTDFPDFCTPPTLTKYYPKFHNANKCFAGVKTESLNYKPPTRFGVIKTDSPKFYKTPSRFTVLSELL